MTDLENLQHAFRESLHSDPEAACEIDFEISERLGRALLADMGAAANDNGEEHMANAASKITRDNVRRAEHAYLAILMMINEVVGDEIPHAHDALSIARSNYALARVRVAVPTYMPDSDNWQRAEVELVAIEAEFEGPTHPVLKVDGATRCLSASKTGVRRVPKRVHQPRRVG